MQGAGGEGEELMEGTEAGTAAVRRLINWRRMAERCVRDAVVQRRHGRLEVCCMRASLLACLWRDREPKCRGAQEGAWLRSEEGSRKW